MTLANNTVLTLQWKVQNNKFVNIRVTNGRSAIEDSADVIAKINIPNPGSIDSDAAFIIPLKTTPNAGYADFTIKVEDYMFKHNKQYIGRSANYQFTATITLMIIEQKDATIGIKVPQSKPPAKPNDIAAIEMLKELHIKLSDPTSADCAIICHGKRLPAHKYILCMRSKVFEVNDNENKLYK